MVFNVFLGGFLALFFMAQSWGALDVEKRDERCMYRQSFFEKGGEGANIPVPDEDFYFDDVFGSSPPKFSLPRQLMKKGKSGMRIPFPLSREEDESVIKMTFPERKKKKKKKKEDPTSLEEKKDRKGERPATSSTSSTSSVLEDWLEGMEE
ncbi:hypothetical protein OAN21_01935 [Alphaproteobacteria bacterium]|nr:hypothetical protein [Alphaproteobacteria bacterium]